MQLTCLFFFSFCLMACVCVERGERETHSKKDLLQGAQVNCGVVNKNPHASAGDTGSTPGPGRSHMPMCHNHREPVRLNDQPCISATEACEPEPGLHNEKSTHHK